ncbi:hypothetical protein GOP47_0010026 [Adiantum capillus-veneris]|uniref:Uncharacterized protein n=1 Tax=Adiantum capillus-veneris TaxID=13818 RepID=A0A9D4UY49_ADICA|nr:hypothetical protein GOP47_0010026 [Adiantum capillus-veneris]
MALPAIPAWRYLALPTALGAPDGASAYNNLHEESLAALRYLQHLAHLTIHSMQFRPASTLICLLDGCTTLQHLHGNSHVTSPLWNLHPHPASATFPLYPHHEIFLLHTSACSLSLTGYTCTGLFLS